MPMQWTIYLIAYLQLAVTRDGSCRFESSSWRAGPKMPIAPSAFYHHPLPQAKPHLATVPASNPTLVQPTQSHVEYQPPTPTSLIETGSSDSGSTGPSSTLSSASRPDTPVLADVSQRDSSLPLLPPRLLQIDTTQISPNAATSAPAARRCPVCWRQGCQLISHKLYTSRKKTRRPQPPSTDIKQPRASVTASIGNARIDPFFDLPVGRSDPEMQQHFRDFFTAQVSSMTDSVRIRAFDAAYCPVLMRQALVDPALCHTFIAMAATYSSIHGQCLQAPNAKLFSIYGRTFRVLRRQLGQAIRPSDTAIMAAINLLMCQGIAFGDKSAMKAHPAVLESMVNSCGGISNLSGQPAALTLWADLYVTLYTGKKPIFLEQARVVPDIPLSNPPALVYGGGWDDLETRVWISQSLLDVCVNTCRLTELLEDRVSGNINPARWEYFNYKRNSMAMRNGMVHSQLFGSGTKGECISLIHNLYLFLVLRLMPWKAPLVNLCEQLQSALLSSGLHDYWGQEIDVLLWLLFMLPAGAEYWEGKQWALQVLLDTLSHYYNRSEQRDWPPDWCEMQRSNLMKFTWSEIYLTPSFTRTCQDLVMMSKLPAQTSTKTDAPASFRSYATSPTS